ncbi:GntR family transcriptional regulator [Paenibacillus radicis (ex Gao et al. 2016)]|uniref:GntR family transcriptional regulator n=1 Tax=Paenibacillus radicis (ex Gao et al. 2016) TaxID=1737354 RepID=A0A917H4T0_9BACL|nr:GntR family transcriptional regulator [Paenibacillus radicis (ex Gao et al. 2016)]GGG66723.1 GntR family transcriptional regulator [Paenibacillus radicis (ex Gao et al. 2016)]
MSTNKPSLPTMPSLPQQEQRKSLGDQIFESIREQIVTMKLVPGSMIYENELAEALGVSRTPVREAIRLLVSEQLLDVLPQRGTRIALISERKVSEARFIREQLELGAFRLAAVKWRDIEAVRGADAALAKLLEEQREAAAAGDAALFFQLDETFHRIVLERAGNATLLQMVYQMRAHLNRARYLAIEQFGDMGRVLEEHALLLDALRQGDPELAASRLQPHIGKIDNELPELRDRYPHYFKT